MTYYTDLTPYEYLTDDIPNGTESLNIGWLENGIEFPVGETSELMREQLLRLIQNHPSGRTRGWHSCSLRHESGRLSYPYSIERDGRKTVLGSAEIRLTLDSGLILIAPNLIFHYIEDHHYLPPASFIDAVLKGKATS
ncbi:DUF7919 family protein [Streptomyces jumonjinensis]|uniref:DUF7919 domain-containing protein n=1 Tax=Streptomyces jumonjinensis TaxID=1945 RepID=A0A646KGU9_STRJU|nr:hypothetical protein [Streptomyces jumonjinensis]MQT01290.1 hypothetical protein [Streptomyces jumonjinensis]